MNDCAKKQGFKSVVKRIPVIGPLAVKFNSWLKPKPTDDSLAGLQAMIAQVRSSMPCYMGDNMVLTRVKGMKMFLPADDCTISPHLILDGEWEPWVTKVFQTLVKPGMTVVDVGANVGYFTLLAAWGTGPSGKVYAFEPEPKNFRLLSRNVDVNGMTWVTVNRKALWNKAGTAELYTTDACGGHSLIGNTQPTTSGKIQVETIPLDNYLTPGQRVDFIKIDAEGAEPFIMEGMQEVLKANPKAKILLEFAPMFLKASGRDPMQFIDWIKGLGYSVKLVQHDATLTTDIDWVKVIADDGWLEMLLLEKA